MTPLLAEGANPLTHVVQHVALKIGDGALMFPILSNHIVMQVLAAALVTWLIPKAVAARQGDDPIGRLVPKGFAGVVEMLCVALRDHVFVPALGKHAPTFTPYLWSLFFFILTCNLLGLLPLADIFSARIFAHQIGGTSTGNIFITLGLASVTFVMMIYNGLRYNGVAYVKHFFMGPPGINVFIAFLEVVALFVRGGALAIRLFANMLAGHLLLAVLLSFVGMAFSSGLFTGTAVTGAVIVASVAIYFLELLVAFLQAFIFTVLTSVFIGMSVNIHHDDEHGHEHEHAEHGAQPAHAAAHG